MKPNITMIGMPSSGKSTVGVLLAKRLGFSFVDVDIVIQEKEGRLLKEIIAGEGMDGLDVYKRQMRCRPARPSSCLYWASWYSGWRVSCAVS